MKLPHTQYESGTVIVERSIKNSKNKVLARENSTKKLGPFSRDEVHARVGGSVSATLARNYHSASVMVSVNIPVHPTEEGVDEGLAWCFNKASEVFDEQLKGANKALDKMSTRNDR